jgi:hypothetical protein
MRSSYIIWNKVRVAALHCCSADQLTERNGKGGGYRSNVEELVTWPRCEHLSYLSIPYHPLANTRAIAATHGDLLAVRQKNCKIAI